MRDVEADIVTALRILPGVSSAGVEAVEFEKRMPFVQVSTLPSQELERFANGPRASVDDLVDVDFDVFAPDLGSVFDAASVVRDWLLSDAHLLPIDPVRVPYFARRPDFNERVRRRGAVVTFRARSY